MCTWFFIIPKEITVTGFQTKMDRLHTDFDKVIEAPERYDERVEQGKQQGRMEDKKMRGNPI